MPAQAMAGIKIRISDLRCYCGELGVLLAHRTEIDEAPDKCTGLVSNVYCPPSVDSSKGLLLALSRPIPVCGKKKEACLDFGLATFLDCILVKTV